MSLVRVQPKAQASGCAHIFSGRDFLRQGGGWGCEQTNEVMQYGKKGFTYKSQYAVIVICSGEDDQKNTYEKLLADGYKLKVVAV